MTYCTHCGAPLPGGVRFCTSCGAALGSRPYSSRPYSAEDAVVTEPAGWTPENSAARDLLPFVGASAIEPTAVHRRRRDAGTVVALALAVMIAAAGVSAWLLLRGEERDVTTAVTPSAPATAPVAPPPAGPPSTPSTTAATDSPQPTSTPSPSMLVPVAVNASSTAPDSVDDAGAPVSYGPENAVDSDRDTAWRAAEGDGVGEFLTLDLGAAYTLTTVGLIPGYDKVDPATGQSRFLQNRRIEQVRWIFDDGSSVVQRFTDDAAMQTTSVSVTTATIRIQIEATRAPQAADGRNFAPISEVLVVSLR